MKLQISVLLFVLFVSIPGFAQTAKFEGFDLDLSSGFMPMHTSSAIENYPNLSIQRDAPKDIPFILRFGYTKAVDERYTVGLSINDNLLPSRKANTSIYSNGTLINAAGSIQWLEHRQGFTFKFGRLMDESNQVYFKVGPTWASQNGVNNNGSAFNGVRIQYTTLGLGVKRLISPKVFALAEMDYARMLPTTTPKTIGNTPMTVNTHGEGYSLLLGLGYQF